MQHDDMGLLEARSMGSEEKQSQPSTGLLSGLLSGSPLGTLGIMPKLTQNDVVVELTTEQLRNLLLEKADQRAKDSVTVEIHEGKIVLRIRLM
jgi:hypothetical protein